MVSQSTLDKSQTGARGQGLGTPGPLLQHLLGVVACCKAAINIKDPPTQPGSYSTYGHCSPPPKLLWRTVGKEKGVEEHWGGRWRKVGGGCVSGVRPGGGRQGPSVINDWVSQHQHSQHAVRIPAARFHPTDSPCCPHPQQRPVPSTKGPCSLRGRVPCPGGLLE